MLSPLKGKVGALKKAETLVEELLHPNPDWKFITNGIREYLYNHTFDIASTADEVLPLLFSYMDAATLRGGASAKRACDTFFDRYNHVARRAEEDDWLQDVKGQFDIHGKVYLDILIDRSEDGMYLEGLPGKIARLVSALGPDTVDYEMMQRFSALAFQQYRLHIENATVTTDDEIAELSQMVGKNPRCAGIPEAAREVSKKNYQGRLTEAEEQSARDPEGFILHLEEVCDFSHNHSTWQGISSRIREAIVNRWVKKSDAVFGLVSFLVQKSNQGSDRDIQVYMSRTMASICESFIDNDQGDLVEKLLDLIMPILMRETGTERNYLGAFAHIYDIGKPIILSNDPSLIDHFEDKLIKYGFCFPEFGGVAEDWSVISNANHLENIRTWMKLIELNPPMMKKLSASLIVNLKLGGVYLKDTDVFQRDITRLLNSDYEDVFYLITSLAAVFPTFYHNIGATGVIRNHTVKIDTNQRMDDLIHFIRKQVHVESSNRIVLMIQRVLDFWMTGDRSYLCGMVPQEVYDNLDHNFRLINLDSEKGAGAIHRAAVKRFPQHGDLRFWDILNTVDRDDLLDLLKNDEIEGLDDRRRDEIVPFIEEYLVSRVPTEMTKILNHIAKLAGTERSGKKLSEVIYEVSDDELREMFETVRKHDVSRVNIEKFINFINVYRMLYDKYTFSEVRATGKLEYYASQNLFNPPPEFFDKLKGDDPQAALDALLEVQSTLKHDILLSPQRFQPLDTISFKRHIAFGIPSMYGEYKERKFDTLRVFFHMNLIKLRLLERVVEDLNVSGTGDMDFPRIKKAMQSFHATYVISGLANQEMNNVFNLLNTPELTLDQLRDLINQMLIFHGGISDRFNETFRYVYKEAIRLIGMDRLADHVVRQGDQSDIDIMIDQLLRNQIMQSPVLQLFDSLLLDIKNRLDELDESEGAQVCLNRDGPHRDRFVSLHGAIDNSQGPVTPEMVRNNSPNDRVPIYYLDLHGGGTVGDRPPIWEAGNKAYGLIFLGGIKDLHIPEGVVLSSYLYSAFNKSLLKDERAMDRWKDELRPHVDRITDHRFGNPNNPQLLSVRSGAVFFMPGVMATITNVGMSKEVIVSLANERNMWFAYDCYRRFIQDIATALYDVDRRVFERIMGSYKNRVGVQLKERMSGEQMKELTREYERELTDRGHHIPRDPYEQLLYSIVAAFRSWNCSTAINYRKYLNISERWGTALILQKMIFGNSSAEDITGVVQSDYKGDEKISLFGEYKTRAQGYDIVSGVAKVFPISEDQKKVFPRYSSIPSLERTQPDMYKMIYDATGTIRSRFDNEVQIEFTIEDGIMYILQVRGLASHVYQVDEIRESPGRLQENLLGIGLAASRGAVAGRVVYDKHRVDDMRKRHPHDRIIIIRPETNPDDVSGIKRSDGILTCLGGMTSHAVLQMRRFGKPGVSDFSQMKIHEKSRSATVTMEDGNTITVREGDFITIDGGSGKVYLGKLKTVPELNSKG